jgi:predicted dehydrogenase
MHTKARIAIIGAGWWTTQTHIPAILQNPHAELAALCDLNPERLRIAAEAFPVGATYTDLHAMFAKEAIDAVVVATHHAGHYAVARDCLTYGKPTLVEKPLTLRASEARDLVQRAHTLGVPLRVGYNHNYMVYMRRSRDVVQAGTLGAVQYISGIFNQHIIGMLRGTPPPREGMIISPGDVYSDPARSGGGFGVLQLTHLAGMIAFITGLRAERVFALMHHHDLRVDLVNALNIAFEGGALASIGGTGNLGGGGRKIDLQIYCERGWIDIDEAAGIASIQGERLPTETYDLSGQWQRRYPYNAPIDDLVAIALGHAAQGVDGETGWRATEIIEAAYRSAAQGGAGYSIAALYDEDADAHVL